MKRTYLDHAAATPVDAEVVEAMKPYWTEIFGNPSSIHAEGVLAKRALADARSSIAQALSVHADEIIFTGSATESAHLAVTGSVRAWMRTHPNVRPHVVVSAIEHDAVLAALRTLSPQIDFSYLPVDAEGIVIVDALAQTLTERTVLVSVMYANNEIGTVQPIKEIAAVIRRWKKDVRHVTRDTKTLGDAYYPLFHSDACQATNYVRLSVPELGVDLLTINAAKIYGPKGVAALVVRRGVQIESIITGGGQEGGKRGGTEHVPLIVGFARALQITESIRVDEVARLLPLRDYLIEGLSQQESVTINGSRTARLPNNVNFSVENVDHEFLVLALDAKGFAVSTKSACNEADAEHSHVLEALCVARGSGGSSGIRISLGRTTTKADIDAFLAALHDILAHMIVSL